uniref:Uncharacterized protein n=1 Tax=Oryza barthii TaxID=65489 RepID=A0A0D3EJX5_9ORYZ
MSGVLGDFVDVLHDLQGEEKMSDSDMIAVLWRDGHGGLSNGGRTSLTSGAAGGFHAPPWPRLDGRVPRCRLRPQPRDTLLQLGAAPCRIRGLRLLLPPAVRRSLSVCNKQAKATPPP